MGALGGPATPVASGPNAKPLDCASPSGAAALVAGREIPLATLCAELRSLTGTTSTGPSARAIFERLIDAELLSAVASFELEKKGLETKLEALVFSPAAQRGWLPPVQTRAGWLAAKVTEVKPGGRRPFDEVRDDVRRIAEGRRRIVEERRLLEKLRSAGKVELRVAL